MSITRNIIEAQGAYAIPRKGDRTVLLRIPDEDVGKVEGGEDWEELIAVVPGMFGIVTGKIEAGENYEKTLSREILEEQKLLKSQELFTNGLPTARIKQIRNQQEVLFTVHGHQFPISQAEIDVNNLVTQEIDDSQLLFFLQEESSLPVSERILRPSVHAILTLFFEYLNKRR